jgi:hypothetical protein
MPAITSGPVELTAGRQFVMVLDLAILHRYLDGFEGQVLERFFALDQAGSAGLLLVEALASSAVPPTEAEALVLMREYPGEVTAAFFSACVRVTAARHGLADWLEEQDLVGEMARALERARGDEFP